jgi:uncharacterized DUF497 family protein
MCPLKWDPHKAATNLRKHGVAFSEAIGVFTDDAAVTIKDDESDVSEQRFATLGNGFRGRILTVVYCYRGDNIRVISARIAERSEREHYEAKG